LRFLIEANMQNDPIVIVGAARTSMGCFQGDLSGCTAPELGAVAIKAAVERTGAEARGHSGSDYGERAAGGRWPSPSPPSCDRRWAALCCRLHYHQQGVRLRHESRDAGP